MIFMYKKIHYLSMNYKKMKKTYVFYKQIERGARLCLIFWLFWSILQNRRVYFVVFSKTANGRSV